MNNELLVAFILGMLFEATVVKFLEGFFGELLEQLEIKRYAKIVGWLGIIPPFATYTMTYGLVALEVWFGKIPEEAVSTYAPLIPLVYLLNLALVASYVYMRFFTEGEEK